MFNIPNCFIAKSSKPRISVFLLREKELKSWVNKQATHICNQITQQGFKAKPGENIVLLSKTGELESIIIGIDAILSHYDSSLAVETLGKHLSAASIKKYVFELSGKLSKDELNKVCIGWGWACYSFSNFKDSKSDPPILLWPVKADKTVVLANIESVCAIRDLINRPANDLNTNALSKAAEYIAKKFKAKFLVIKDKDLIKQNFPMIYAVGQASVNKPQLVEINWGLKKHPKISIVGKGITYDTGGLDIKPPRFMALMKKDMGGSAQALGLAWMIMALKLPVQLQVLLPIAENSVSGNAFRPGDILQTRKGHSVEVIDTDAEGRLVLGDALTYACENNPELVIDFATLTGAARVALGTDIPAYYSNNERYVEGLKKYGFDNDDPVWPLPLWKNYFGAYKSNIASFKNDDNSGMAGSIKAALFLEQFIDKHDWIHIDCFAWEPSGKPGKPQGGADTGMRAVFQFLQDKYKK